MLDSTAQRGSADLNMTVQIHIYIYIYTRCKDEAKASSLFDHFGQFDVPIFDAKAQVLGSSMLEQKSSDF